MKHHFKKILTITIVLAAVLWQLYQNSNQLSLPESTDSLPQSQPGKFTDWFSEVKTQGAGLELLENCQLIIGRNNDGDSFHVKHEKGENQFRLYFVDAPESEFRTYRPGEDNGERIDEQAAYFGTLKRDQTTQIGKQAADFVLRILKQNTFKVLTKWEDVVRPGREYCFVIVPWEGREVSLHELLVAQGLVRIHTRGADLPGGRTWRQQRDYLRQFETEIKRAKIGAWSF